MRIACMLMILYLATAIEANQRWGIAMYIVLYGVKSLEERFTRFLFYDDRGEALKKGDKPFFYLLNTVRMMSDSKN